MFFSKLTLLALAGSVAAAPTTITTKSTGSETTEALVARGIDCGTLALGLTYDDCTHMSNIGMAGQGVNANAANGNIWIGEDGPNKFTFVNTATTPYNAPVTVIIWDFPTGDYEASFMNVRSPKISYSLPNPGDSITISIANGVSGGWSQLTDHMTTLSEFGQVYNTWGEFTTGSWATFDITRLVNMGGNVVSAQVQDGGCVSDMNTCSFHCKDGANWCGESGTYDLLNCAAGSQTGASIGTWDGLNPEGGCQGWNDGGSIKVSLGNY